MKVKRDGRGAPCDVTSSSCGAAPTGLTAPTKQETETSEGSERESKRTSEQSAACRRSPDEGESERDRESERGHPARKSLEKSRLRLPLQVAAVTLRGFLGVCFFSFFSALPCFLRTRHCQTAIKVTMCPTTTRAGNTLPGGLAGIRPAIKVESPPRWFLEDRWTSWGSRTGGGWRRGSGGGGGVKGEVGGGGWGRSVGGEREGARGVVPSRDFKNGAARPTCPGLFQQESGSREQQPCLLPLPLLLSVSHYSLAEVTPSLPPSLSLQLPLLPPSYAVLYSNNPSFPARPILICQSWLCSLNQKKNKKKNKNFYSRQSVKERLSQLIHNLTHSQNEKRLCSLWYYGFSD